MMLLSEAERDRLLVFLTAELARARRRRGLRLNVVEATALVADAARAVSRCTRTWARTRAAWIPR